MSVEIRERRFAEVVGAEVAYEKLADGYLFTEGPLWDPRQRRLLFSDIPGNLIAQWEPGRRRECSPLAEQHVERPRVGPGRPMLC